MNDRIRLRDIAGYCAEDAVWKMVVGLCDIVADNNQCVLTPDTIIVDNSNFIHGKQNDSESEFLPPESAEGELKTDAQHVWTIGALIYYVSSGRVIFGGYGGEYQRNHPKVQLPSLQKAHCALTHLMQRCLAYEPTERVSVQELHSLALNGLQKCMNKERQKRVINKEVVRKTAVISVETLWPEEMIKS